MSKNDFFNNLPLSEVVSRMVDASGRPLKAIAGDVGMSYTSLYRQLDPNDDGAKIGVDALLPLIRACMGSAPYAVAPGPVLWLNSKTGYKAVSLEVTPSHDDVRDEVMDDLNRCNEFWQAVHEGKLPPEKVLPLHHAAQKELDETMESYRREWMRKGGAGE